MNEGTANHRLNRMVMFSLIKKCNMDSCFRCGEKIESVKEMSIDHMEDWLHSKDPVKLFFDTENIKFSHISCNSRVTRRLKYKTTEEKKEAKKKHNMDRYANRAKPHHIVTEEKITWAKNNPQFSLRKRAREIGIHHETLRRFLINR